MTATTGDSETITVFETQPGSNIFISRETDLVTTAGSGVVRQERGLFPVGHARDRGAQMTTAAYGPRYCVRGVPSVQVSNQPKVGGYWKKKSAARRAAQGRETAYVA